MGKNGGARPGAGRKPKSDELALIEALSPYDEIAQTKLIEGVENGSFHHLKLFYEYRYGKPKQMIDVTTNGNDINNNDLSNLSYEQLLKITHGTKGTDNTGG
jgi:hypothetical protein